MRILPLNVIRQTWSTAEKPFVYRPEYKSNQ